MQCHEALGQNPSSCSPFQRQPNRVGNSRSRGNLRMPTTKTIQRKRTTARGNGAGCMQCHKDFRLQLEIRSGLTP